MGGTNDSSEEGLRAGLNNLRSKIGNKKRVIIVGVPKRYDLDPDCYPNMMKVIERKNEMVKRFCDFYNYKYLCLANSKREYFTKHGLHFNKLGKRWLAERIQGAADSFLC